MSSDFNRDDEHVFEVFTQDQVDKVEESICVQVYGQELQLSLLMKEDDLAPLFSGAAWAGTMLWDAAIHLTRRFLSRYRSDIQPPDNTLRVIELGAGIGVPGMAARVAGARHVVITEQDDLLALMHQNVAANSAVLRVGEGFDSDTVGAIHARALSWGVDETTSYLTQSPGEAYDVILSCDCIYEPLYGQSWRALAQTMELLCLANPRARVMMGVERRNQDGIDKFLGFVDSDTKLEYTLEEETYGAKQNLLQLYMLRLAVEEST